MSEPFFNGPLAILVRRLLIHSPPDPWPPEIDAAVRARDAVPICPDCLHPQTPHQWFCPHCNYPTGDFVALMPYQQIFCIGEVLRRGVTGPGKNSAGQNVGFAIYGLGQYSLFAPLYWFWLMSKAGGKPICQVQRPALETDLEPAESAPESSS